MDWVQAFRVGDYVMKPAPYRGSVFMDVEKRIAGMEKTREAVHETGLSVKRRVESAPRRGAAAPTAPWSGA